MASVKAHHWLFTYSFYALGMTFRGNYSLYLVGCGKNVARDSLHEMRKDLAIEKGVDAEQIVFENAMYLGEVQYEEATKDSQGTE